MSNNSDSLALFAESDSLFQDLSPSEESMVTGGIHRSPFVRRILRRLRPRARRRLRRLLRAIFH